VTIKKLLGRPKILVSLLGGLLVSWFGRETITLFLFPSKSFDGRSYLIQSFLLFAYTLIFTSLCFFFYSLLERYFFHRIQAIGIAPTQYENIIVFAAIILLLIYPLQYIKGFLSFPYPLEIRETASIYPAVAFAKGVNPYSIQNFPEHIYVYGFLYPLSLAPFINLGDHPMLVARYYNVLFLVFFLGISFWIFRKRNASINSSLIGVLILLNSICYIWAINGARPDVPGLFFALFGFGFLLKRDLNTSSLLLCAVSCALSFYFKQYMLFSTLVVAVFLFFFVSKQKGYFFITAVLTLVLASFFLIRRFSPLYFEYSILHHIALGKESVLLDHNERATFFMIAQSYKFFGYYWILCFLYLFYVYKSISAFNPRRIKDIHLSPFNIHEPFIRNASVNIFDIGIIVAVLILSLGLGRHDGNQYTYYGELLLPFLLYLIIPKIDELFKITLHRSVIQILILAFCIFPFRLNYIKNFMLWDEAFSTISQYADRCDNIYDETPFAAIYKIEHNMYPVYNNGQTGYGWTVITNRGNILDKISVVPVELLDQRLLDWNDAISESIKDQEFDCIFSQSKQEITNYVQAGKINRVLGRTIYFYVRNPSEPNEP
jgi:hypothetical protein